MKATAFVLSVLVAGLLAGGCCSSILCQATRAAEPQLACGDEQLKVENLTSQVVREPADARRFLRVSGCGRQEVVACAATNLPPEPAQKVRGQKPARVTGLEVKWACEAIPQTALRFVEGGVVGSASAN
ncbi:MAG TPA: hypothetical protein PK668_17545 [Myxococcota bacterium]|nr:hypothetical protein [Myxococcota bacterium]HRY94966.1 hypothetical protein [Myxococcota bacterium]HSA19971.1 hypothetical protein [Myxococcota bacterium]